MAIKAGDILYTFRGDLSKLNTAMAESRRVAGAHTDALLEGGRQIGIGLAAAGASVAAGLGVAIKASMDFEQQITMVAVKTGKTGEALDTAKKKLSEMALALGESTVFSAGEAAGAFEVLAQMGFDVENMAQSTLKSLLDLAAATQFDLAGSVEIATSTMNGFGLTQADLGRITNVLAAATVRTAGSMSDLATSLPIVGTTAKLSGQSLEEVTAILGVMYDAGIDASTAASSLRNIFMRINNPTKQFAEGLAEAGINLNEFRNVVTEQGLIEGLEYLGVTGNDVSGMYDALRIAIADTAVEATEFETAIASDGLAGALKFLEDAGYDSEAVLKLLDPQFKAAGVSAQQMADAMSEEKGGGIVRALALLTGEGMQALDMLKLFGVRGGPVAATLMDMSEKATGLKDGFLNLGDEVQRMADEQMNTFAGKMEELRGSFETLTIRIGDVKTVMEPLVVILTEMVRWVSTLAAEHPKLTLAVTSTAAAFAAMAIPVGGLLIVLPNLVRSFVLLQPAMAAIIAVLGGPGNLLALLGGTGGLLIILGAVAYQIYRVIEALGDLKEANERLKESMQQANDQIGMSIKKLEEDHGVHVRNMIERFATEAERLKALQAVWEEVSRRQKEGLATTGDEAQNAYRRVAEAAAEAARQQEIAAQQSQSAWSRFWNWMIENSLILRLLGVTESPDAVAGQRMAAGGRAPGGLTLVGERGPEIVSLPTGAQIYGSLDTERMLRGSSGPAVVNFNAPLIHANRIAADDPIMVDAMSRRLYESVRDALAARGIPAYGV